MSLNDVRNNLDTEALTPQQIATIRDELESAKSTYIGKIGTDSQRLCAEEILYFKHRQRTMNIVAKEPLSLFPFAQISDMFGLTKSSMKRTATAAKVDEEVDLPDDREFKRQKIDVSAVDVLDELDLTTGSKNNRTTQTPEAIEGDHEDEQRGEEEANHENTKDELPVISVSDETIDEYLEHGEAIFADIMPATKKATMTKGEKKENAHDIERNKQHRVYVRLLTEKLESCVNKDFTAAELNECKGFLAMMVQRYKEKFYKTDWITPKKKPYPDTIQELRAKICGESEKIHPWMDLPNQEQNVPHMLMRASDPFSQCKLDDIRVGILSGSASSNLLTDVERKEWLRRHGDWSNGRKTPWISCSKDIFNMDNQWMKTFEERQKKNKIKPNTKLHLFNTHVLHAMGIPVLRMKDEMTYFGVRDLSKTFNSIFEHEYIIPYKVPIEAIVITYAEWKIKRWCKENRKTYVDFCKEIAESDLDDHEREWKGGDPSKSLRKGAALQWKVDKDGSA